ncbi:ImmA/IrrE family metallo-endopeptidase [Lichenibacterium ramalinae]|nr:ImmA/IrrE family metallo-endopeptidase [Lichenibacterium ramalinae]
MPLTIDVAPHVLDEGSPEERATFGRFSIDAGVVSLTEGVDTFVHSLQSGPLVPAYHAAQWFAWNWWRLRWEPRRGGEAWAFAHRMATIGEGYLWPQIEISTDGLRTVLQCRASRADAEPFRYTASRAVIVPAHDVERALDAFIPEVIARLRRASVGETNLDRLWRDVVRERGDPELHERRKLEALLGAEPDEADEELLATLEGDLSTLGRPIVEEIAAGGTVASLTDMESQARAIGSPLHRHDMIRIGADALRPQPGLAAWKVGRDVARKVRDVAGCDRAPVADRHLAAFAGADDRVLSTKQGTPPFSFSLRETEATETVVLRSPIRVNRRFNLARILGDRLMFGDGKLSPATHAYTYRQRAQRAFAAELLCPSVVIDAETATDDSTDRQSEVAEHFGVSDYVVRMVVERTRFEDQGDEEEAEVTAT